MKKLIFTFALAIVLLPNVCNASMNQLELNKVALYDKSTLWTQTTSFTGLNYYDVSFTGYQYKQDTSRVWPYNRVLFYLSSSVANTYNFTFLVHANYFKDDGFATLTFNNMPCEMINYYGYVSSWNCPNVYVYENDNNIIRFNFTNNEKNGSSFFYGISLVRGDLNNSNANNELITWMQFYNKQTQDAIKNQEANIIDNQNKNSQDQIENANNNHKETMDTITNSDVDSDGISSLTSTQLPTTGVLSSILNMPIQFFNALLNNLDTTTCKAVVIPIPFVDSTFTFPCVRSLLDELGALEFYNAIGSLVGGIALFNYTLYMGHQFKKMEDLEDGKGEFGGL